MNILQTVLLDPFEKCLEKIVDFLPNLLTSILLVVAGMLIALVIKVIFAKLLKTLGMDRFTVRFGFAELLKKCGIVEPVSVLLAKFIGGVTFLIFAILAMRALQVMALEQLLEKFLLYLPNIFVAAIILTTGYLLGNFLGRAALIASVNAGVRFAGIIGGFVKFTIIIFSAAMALEHLGIGKETVVIAFAIIFGGVVLALALAFGLGGRDMAKDYLQKKFQGEREPDDNGISHL